MAGGETKPRAVRARLPSSAELDHPIYEREEMIVGSGVGLGICDRVNGK